MMSLTFGMFTQVSDSGPQGPLVGIVLERKKLHLISEEILVICANRVCDQNKWIHRMVLTFAVHIPGMFYALSLKLGAAVLHVLSNHRVEKLFRCMTKSTC